MCPNDNAWTQIQSVEAVAQAAALAWQALIGRLGPYAAASRVQPGPELAPGGQIALPW